MAEVEVLCCSNPGCDQPGTNRCSACKTKAYCGPICQTADWTQHREECPGHLRKVGIAHVEKAKGFHRENNYAQALRYAELALTKLKLLKDDRPLEALNSAFSCKTYSLRFLNRYREAMENAKERYTMWAMNDIRHPTTIWAAFDLIECCLFLEEFVDAELFARTAYEIINERTDNIMPPDEQQQSLARGARFLARATFCLAKAGGIAPEVKQATGVKSIAPAREALEINTRLHGVSSIETACDMATLADIFHFFNDDDNDEVLRLYEQSIAIVTRVQGSLSFKVAISTRGLGAYMVAEQREHIMPMIWTEQ